MNILEEIDQILGIPNTFIGVHPDEPDDIVSLNELPGVAPKHYFGKTEYSHKVQARVRRSDSGQSRNTAEQIQNTLNQYEDDRFSIRQTANVLPIGQDEHDPPRSEYTVEFLVSMK